MCACTHLSIKNININNTYNKDKRINHQRINKLFAENPRKVYRELISDTIEVDKPPQKEDLETFWRPLYETEKQHQEGPWVEKIIESKESKPKMIGLLFEAVCQF